jgi:hypothetical protein
LVGSYHSRIERSSCAVWHPCHGVCCKQLVRVIQIDKIRYDGIAEVWIDSLEDWMEVVSDESFVKVIAGKSRDIN